MSRLDDLLLVGDPHEIFPPTPALDVRIESALTHRRARRNLVLSAAVIVAAFAFAALASPSARSALSSWLRLGGVTIEQRDELPPVDYRGRPDFGARVTLEQARAITPFHVRVLPASRLGAPTAVYVRRSGMVTSVYGPPDRPRLLVSQWRGARYGFMKVLPHGTAAQPVSLGFGVGYWVPEAHAFHYNGPDGAMYEERFYLSAPALVWAERVTMFRLEGELSRDEALEYARELR